MKMKRYYGVFLRSDRAEGNPYAKDAFLVTGQDHTMTLSQKPTEHWSVMITQKYLNHAALSSIISIFHINRT